MSERVYPPVIAAARLAFRLLKLRFVSTGLDNVPRTGGAVLVSNHVSYLDFIFCGLAVLPAKRLVRFMAKEAVFRHRISGPLMRGMHHIPVDRSAGAAAYGAAVEALRRGEVVGVFPEATISRSFTLKEFKSGAARMAIAAGVPLVPMVTWGGQRLMTKGHKRDFRRGRTIALTVGEPLRPGPDADPVAVTAELRARMTALLEQTWAGYPDRPAGPGDTFWVPAHLGGSAPTREQAAALEATDRSQPAAS
ncbi:MAG: lysophospholipid acyltransferase family protein [Mycobacteriales bacterium]